jgi:hypothetical protein
LYSNYGVRRAYVALQKTMNQFVNTKEYKGGFDYIDYNNLKWFVDKDCPANSIYIPDESELEIYQLADFDWMDEDGAVLSRVSGKDAYEAIIYYYSELGCSMRNAMCKVGDITEA